jgi:hypothetical protein
MITRAQQLRDMASECRSIAALAKRPEIRDQLLEIADEFELLAEGHDNAGKTAVPTARRVPQPGVIEEISAPNHKSLIDLYAYWLAKRGSRIGPSRSAIRPEELALLLPNLALVDVVGDPPRFRFRLFGTNLAQGYGQDLTGKFLDQIDLGSVSLKKNVINFCIRIVRERRPQVVRVRFIKQTDGRSLDYERIGLPLSEDGKAVSMILCAFAFDKEFLNAVT